jgi:osmoprotectant transport system ATP-binding protein
MSGEISLFGTPLNYDAINQVRLTIGYVVQQTGLFPHLTIEENITLLGRVSKQSVEKIGPRLRHLIEMAQIPESYLNRFPYQLSGGEQQKVGLCRALFLNPPLVLMDEPFASLDSETKQSIYSYVKNFQQVEPRTIVLVTHDWTEASYLADKFILLESGAIKAEGNIDQLQALKQIHLPEG